MDGFAKALLFWYKKIRVTDRIVHTSRLDMMRDISLLVSKASEIAKLLPTSALEASEAWTLVSDPAASVASGHSAASHTSCLSAHGGPHCFLPGHLFEHLQREDGSSPAVFIRAKARDFHSKCCHHA